MLWNIFHSLPGFTAYYEPLHDCLLTNYRHNPSTDSTHQGVQAYWNEYADVLDIVEKLHRPQFAFERLLLEADEPYPELQAYIQELVDVTRTTVPVLQFNRVDFRLPWLKQRFPTAVLIHLHRNPRDSWVSMMRSLPAESWEDPTPEDPYDLFAWALELSDRLPFVAPHVCPNSYARHYYLSKLSMWMGQRVADCSLDYDHDFGDDPERGLRKLVEVEPRLRKHLKRAGEMVGPISAGNWKQHRSEEWFGAIEDRVDSHLESLGLAESFGIRPLKEIVRSHGTAWEACPAISVAETVHQLTRIYAQSRQRELEYFFSKVWLDQAIKNIEGELQRLREEEKSWGEQREAWAEYEAAWRALQADWEWRKAGLEKQITDWEHRCLEAEQQNAEWERRGAEWELQLTDWNSARASWERERAAWARSRDAWEQERARWQFEKQQWNQERSQLQVERSASELQIQTLRLSESELRGEVRRLTEQIDWFMHERRELERQQEVTQQQLAAAEYQVQLIIGQRQVLIEQLALLQRQLAPFQELGPAAIGVAQGMNWLGRKLPWLANPLCHLINRFVLKGGEPFPRAAPFSTVPPPAAAPSGDIPEEDATDQRRAA